MVPANDWAKREALRQHNQGHGGSSMRIARVLLRNRHRYQSVVDLTKVPLVVLAAIHQRESNADFSTNLAQGARHRPVVPIDERHGRIRAGQPEEADEDRTVHDVHMHARPPEMALR